MRLRIQRGGRRWSAVPAVGEAKARRIAEFLRLLLPETAATGVPLQAQLQHLASRAGASATTSTAAAATTAPAPCTTADNDWKALQAWIEANAGRPEDPSHSAATAKAYRIAPRVRIVAASIER